METEEEFMARTLEQSVRLQAPPDELFDTCYLGRGAGS
jgi:hypothetical protein